MHITSATTAVSAECFYMGDKEVELEVTWHFSYSPGYPQTRWEPEEPAELEITSLEVAGMSEDLCGKFFDANNMEEIERELGEAISQAEQDAADEMAEAKYEAWKEDRYANL